MLLTVVILLLPLSEAFRIQTRDKKCKCMPAEKCDEGDDYGELFVLDQRIFRMSCSNSNEICCDSPIEEYPDSAEIPKEESTEEVHPVKCGLQRIKNVQARITSGSVVTKFGEFPWNLIIRETTTNNKQQMYKCGAALIHPKIAVTAAHCVSDFVTIPEKLVLRAGEWDTNSRLEPLPHQDRFVEDIIIHEYYHPLSLAHDIAVIVLKSAFDLVDNVGVVCITSNNEIDESKCVAAGWGKDAYTNGKYSPIMKKIQLPIVPRDKCLSALRGTKLGKSYRLHKSFLCAGGQANKDACKGDGGSPLICPVKGTEQYIQRGIVSWGIGCGSEGVPGVYVDVEQHIDWIDTVFDSKHLDKSYYTA